MSVDKVAMSEIATTASEVNIWLLIALMALVTFTIRYALYARAMQFLYRLSWSKP